MPNFSSAHLLVICSLFIAALGAGEVSVRGTPSRIRVDAAKHGFVDATGQRFVPCGVSYYRPGTGWAPQLWKQFDAEATRLDFPDQQDRLGL